MLDQAFARTWAVAGRAAARRGAGGPGRRREGDGEVRVITGEPGRERAFRVIELLAAGSVERLWITDAYLVAPPRLFQALRDAARDGVDVRLLVPGSSDLPLIRNLSRIGYRDLLRSGVRIYEWDGPMLHAKTIVADGRWVRIGSSNLNPSSLIGNYELDVLIEDPDAGGGHGAAVPAGHRPEPRGAPPAAARTPADQRGAAHRAHPRGARDRESPDPAGARREIRRRAVARRSGPSRATPGARCSSRSAAIFVALGVLFFALPAPDRVRLRRRSAPGWRSARAGRRSGGGRIGRGGRTDGRLVPVIPSEARDPGHRAWRPSLRSG